MHDGATLINKENHQDFVMQFAETKIRYNNAISFSFRKSFIHEGDKVSELVEEEFSECFNKDFNDVFSSSVQYVAVSAVAKESNVEK